MKQRIISVLLVAALAFSLAGCSGSSTTTTTTTTTTTSESNGLTTVHVTTNAPSEETKFPRLNSGIITGMGLDENGNFTITRDPAKAEPMGAKNSWTIFVYLCGSNLESDWGLATGDLQEMIDGSVDSKVRYIVTTGGSTEWQNYLMDETKLERYIIEDGDINLIEALDYSYMNDPNTLRDFLSWGVKNYPADKMGLVIWDHGGGSIGGVCVDYIFYDDLNNDRIENSSDYTSTLTLHGISRALSQVFEDMTDQFEFIGYDACLMGTLENAFMLSPYARYMYASEETEPGYGWDYAAIGRAIGRTGRISGEKLGKVVCDSFYDSCAEVEQEANATLACVDLSEIDNVVLSFDAFARNMMDLADDPASLSAIARSTKRVEFFGGNSADEGYYNLADMAGVVNAVASFVPGAKTVLNAISRAVTYHKNGIFHEDACGLALYYPLYVEDGSGELGRFAEVVSSPYYYGYVAKNYYAAANGGLNGYDPTVSLAAWGSAVDLDVENIIEDYGSAHITGMSPYISFVEEPQLYENGSYGFVLTPESIPYVSSIEADVYFLSDDGVDLVYLGGTTDIIADWDNFSFIDNFDGLWFSMPNGELVSTSVVSETTDFSIYTTPVLLNGEETNLRFVVDNHDFTITLYGVWDSLDEYGMPARNSYELTDGDIIQPIFRGFDQNTGEEKIYYGEEYVYNGSDEWAYNYMFNSDFIYQFRIYDIYGDNYTSDGVFFKVEDGKPYFYPEE